MRYPIIFVALSALALQACRSESDTDEKEICACFDVASYKWTKKHRGAKEAAERCKTLLNNHLDRSAKNPGGKEQVMLKLAHCPAARDMLRLPKPGTTK